MPTQVLQCVALDTAKGADLFGQYRKVSQLLVAATNFEIGVVTVAGRFSFLAWG